MVINVLFLILGFALLIKGADYLVKGASDIAKKLCIPQIIIGLTIVSIGTSMPELIVSLNSAINHHSDIAIGNVVGSNISNLFFILGICAAIKPLKFKNETVRLEIPLVIFLTALLYILGNNGNGNYKIITKSEGLILVICCTFFVLYNIYMAKKNNKSNDDEENNISIRNKKNSIFKSLYRIIIGIVGLKFGGDFVVDSASAIATSLGVSEKIIGLTIVAFSTSLPELITSITATIRNEIDMAIGNVIGSNIFNIVLIVGATALIRPIDYSISYNKDIIILMIGMIVLFVIPFIGEKNKISRFSGLAYVVSYISYLASMIYISVWKRGDWENYLHLSKNVGNFLSPILSIYLLFT